VLAFNYTKNLLVVEVGTEVDKSWMLNPKGIRAAKECINIVKKELGIKLTLADPEFMQVLHEYVDSTQSAELGHAYSRLLAMAGVGKVMQGLEEKIDVGHSIRPVELGTYKSAG